MTFQEALRKARGHRPQAEIAAAIGVKQSTISSWESDDAGTQCLPAAHRLAKVADAYKLPAERLRKLWMSAAASRAAA